ncbi:MAG: Patatin [Candidatus Magnetoglobus multicellularis str. Araruama]|uniref:Patatin n=1 Tax=Candidatus Magnetoglobus multicellularis str. Araruama TaxID=890399 RepID=A0A1V1P004_9BACT|nr:MAG: Patatin [Candidatus Magnetoglobus multicellularis str. Araruama]
MEGVGSGDFYNSFNIINYGVDAAMAKINQITPFSLIEADYKQYINNHRSNRKCNVPIAFIKMNNAGNKSADVIKKAIKTKPVNGTINFDQLENELLYIAKIYDYEMVDYHLSKNIETNQWGIEVNAKEKSWGPKYINFGLTVESDLKKESNFNLLVLYKKKEQNYLGGESLIHACFGDGRYLSYEFYQPLDAKRNFFITPHLSYSKKAANYRLSDSLEPFNCVNIKEHIGFDFGCRIGDNSEIRAGYLFKRIQYEKYDLWSTNQIFINKQKHGMLKLQIAFDNLDSAYFPSKGLSFKSYYYYQSKNWGSDVKESGIVFSGILPISFYKNTTVINKLRTKVPLNNASDLPGGTDSLGGFLKISGFEMDSLVGNYYLLYNLIFQRKILELPMVFGKGVYLGASLDAGNIWLNHRAINKDDLIMGTSVFVGAETFLGPIYLAAGFAEYGKSSAYINIGQHF